MTKFSNQDLARMVLNPFAYDPADLEAAIRQLDDIEADAAAEHDECGQLADESRAAIEKALVDGQSGCNLVSEFGTDEKMLPTKWVLVAEFVGPDGGRVVGSVESQDLAEWDRDGLLRYAEQHG